MTAFFLFHRSSQIWLEYLKQTRRKSKFSTVAATTTATVAIATTTDAKTMVASTQNLHHRSVRDVLPTTASGNGTTTTAATTNDTNNSKARRHNMFGWLVTNASSGNSLFSKQSIAILILGTLIGYVVLPILLVENANMGGSIVFNTNPEDSLRHLGVGEDDIMSRLIENKKLLSLQSMPTDRSPHIMETAVLSDHRRKKILVTGGAGFVGSHLVDKLMMEGHEVTVVDNFFTGQKKNVAHWFHHPNFR